MPNIEALIDHKKVSVNPTKAEWQSTGVLPMTKEQCEAQLRERTVWGVGTVKAGEQQHNMEIDVTSLRRCVPVELWDSVEKYSPEPKDVFRP
jgi:hypothetical protein